MFFYYEWFFLLYYTLLILLARAHLLIQIFLLLHLALYFETSSGSEQALHTCDHFFLKMSCCTGFPHLFNFCKTLYPNLGGMLYTWPHCVIARCSLDLRHRSASLRKYLSLPASLLSYEIQILTGRDVYSAIGLLLSNCDTTCYNRSYFIFRKLE